MIKRLLLIGIAVVSIGGLLLLGTSSASRNLVGIDVGGESTDSDASGGDYTVFANNNGGGGNSYVDRIIYNTWGPPYRPAENHDGQYTLPPLGAQEGPIEASEGFAWANGAVANGQWNNNTAPYLQAWCQAVQQKGGAGGTGFRVQIKNMRLYGLIGSADGEWVKIQDSNTSGIGGMAADRNFQNGRGLDIRNESSGGASLSMLPGYIVHPWINAWPRSPRPSGMVAGFAAAEIRLIQGSTTQDLNNIKVLAACGWDYYGGPYATEAIASGIGVSRHTYVTPEWQTYSFISLPINFPGENGDYSTQIRNNPPPLN